MAVAHSHKESRDGCRALLHEKGTTWKSHWGDIKPLIADDSRYGAMPRTQRDTAFRKYRAELEVRVPFHTEQYVLKLTSYEISTKGNAGGSVCNTFSLSMGTAQNRDIQVKRPDSRAQAHSTRHNIATALALVALSSLTSA